MARSLYDNILKHASIDQYLLLGQTPRVGTDTPRVGTDTTWDRQSTAVAAIAWRSVAGGVTQAQAEHAWRPIAAGENTQTGLTDRDVLDVERVERIVHEQCEADRSISDMIPRDVIHLGSMPGVGGHI